MPLSYYVSQTGAVICQNHRGLIFFLPGEPLNCVKAPKAGSRSPAAPQGNAERDFRATAPV
ncbi:hypothetical protein D3C72_2130510 [compost metagenome]